MKWLKVIRNQKCMTQSQVANHVKITQASYANIELGKRKPCVKTAKAIAEVLGFDWTEFYKAS